MFWRKKTAVADSDTALYSLAAQLGMEKRFSPRVSYPAGTDAGLPQFFFEDHKFAVHDLSIGGCSLLDPTERFGAQIGIEHTLVVDWGGAREPVKSRLVGRVDHRRNFQFLDLPPARGEKIKHLIAPGVRGSGLAQIRDPGLHGLVLDALEMWTSSGGDSITIESHLQRVATIFYAGQNVVIPREAWPVDGQGRPISRENLQSLILFIANAPNRSGRLGQLLKHLVDVNAETGRD